MVVGECTLGEKMKCISKEEELSKIYTNHSIRATAVTVLDNCGYEVTDLKKKKDWIEQLIVLAPTKLKPAAPSCWDHFRGKAYHMPWVK